MSDVTGKGKKVCRENLQNLFFFVREYLISRVTDASPGGGSVEGASDSRLIHAEGVSLPLACRQRLSPNRQQPGGDKM